MDKINGKIPRPVKIIGQKSFSIEETSIYKQQGKGGIMEISNVPYEICFKSLLDIKSSTKEFNVWK